MKRGSVLLGFMVMVFFCSTAFGFQGRREHQQGPRVSQAELLAQLPAEKEMLFHQSMREAKDKASTVGTQIKELRKEIKEIFLADPFNEKLYLEKRQALESLHAQRRKTMEAAILNLAKQFTGEERKILAQLLPEKIGFGRPLHKQMQKQRRP